MTVCVCVWEKDEERDGETDHWGDFLHVGRGSSSSFDL